MKVDLQTYLDNAVAAQRHEQLKDSPQLLLGEMILKLEAVENKGLPLFIDIDDKRPMGVDSCRISYCELAIQTERLGSCQTDEVEHQFDDGDTFYKHRDIGKESPTVSEWTAVLKEAIGKTFTGYKGGSFTMGKNTPVWLAEYGDSGVETKDGDVYTCFVDVVESDDKVVLITKSGDDLY